jgi:hypothetical protein
MKPRSVSGSDIRFATIRPLNRQLCYLLLLPNSNISVLGIRDRNEVDRVSLLLEVSSNKY